ncbi:hypothetical protein B0A55_06820 [Friedmanniomyces simplex]|uniref:Uncharacterized protein n=1 Tax=Friedmanniomyces simplex TaxID=329884 RepID=A0A4V5NI44_9PEZI|nr:hypothetical protein B0A55_06820 [Friedmanniomyces simplex]
MMKSQLRVRRTKGRYWIVVKCTAESVWGVPTYTNGNTKLANIKKKHWSKYYSLRPDTVAPKDFQNQSRNNTPWSIGCMKEHHKTIKGRKMRNTMVVRITEVYRRAIDDADEDYNIATAQHEGVLGYADWDL